MTPCVTSVGPLWAQDHGWQLGEHNIWGKHTNFELGARVPLVFRAAGQTTPVRSNALVESVDIYPTLAQLAGLVRYNAWECI